MEFFGGLSPSVGPLGIEFDIFLKKKRIGFKAGIIPFSCIMIMDFLPLYSSFSVALLY